MGIPGSDRGGERMTGYEEYGVLRGLKHMRYDYEDSRGFMNRVLPSLKQMRANSEIYKWQGCFSP